MGMFDKDKTFGLRLDELVPQGEEFTLWNAKVSDQTVDTRFGPAEQAELEITRKGSRERMTVATIASAIVNKIKEQEPGDLPAVVCWLRVNTAAQENVAVLRFIRPLNAEREQTPAPETTPQV